MKTVVKFLVILGAGAGLLGCDGACVLCSDAVASGASVETGLDGGTANGQPGHTERDRDVNRFGYAGRDPREGTNPRRPDTPTGQGTSATPRDLATDPTCDPYRRRCPAQ